MKKKLRRLVRKKPIKTPSTPQKITSQTMSAHREEVLDNARKYIYPLRHSKRRLVTLSLGILSVAVVIFFTYCTLALYKFQSTSMFLYRVSQVIPFPVAKAGSDFVAYENYLFEINHYTHYYKNQQQLDFESDAGKRQLQEFKKRALDKIVNDAYIKQIAEQRGISVSTQEVDQEIATVRNQNRLGGSDEEFRNVLKDFWGWSVDDFRRSLKQQLLAQKVLSNLDSNAHDRANQAYDQLQSGKDFKKLAAEVSEDPSTKDNGGEFGFRIEKNNRDISATVVEELFKLKQGEYSAPVDVGYGIEIVKNLEQKDDRIKAAHIVFNFKNINDYLNDIKEEKPAKTYIKP
jgi:foldase protein PrsA